MGLDPNLAEQLKPIPFLGKQSNHYSAMLDTRWKHLLYGQKHKMKPTNPNAHTYVNGTDVKTHGYAVTHNTFLQ